MVLAVKINFSVIAVMIIPHVEPVHNIRQIIYGAGNTITCNGLLHTKHIGIVLPDKLQHLLFFSGIGFVF